MANFGVAQHAHIDAGLCSLLLTLLVYGIKWLFRLRFPELVFAVPFFPVVFMGFYLCLYVVFLALWNRK